MTALAELRAQLVELQEQRASCPGTRRGPLDRRIAETRDAIADMETRGVDDVATPEPVAATASNVVPFERPARRRTTRGGVR